MAFICLKCPTETARILSEVDFGDFGEKVDAATMHVTCVYLGQGLSVERVASMIPTIFEVVQGTKPFTVSTSRVTTFPPNPDDGVPIIAPVDSNELHTLHDNLVKALNEAVPDFPPEKYSFSPHVTLGYGKDPLVHADNAVDITLPTIEWAAHELTLWGGDSGDYKLIVTFPLSVVTKTASCGRETALYRAFAQLANRGHLLD
jgi:2'-5' RNA ligase